MLYFRKTRLESFWWSHSEIKTKYHFCIRCQCFDLSTFPFIFLIKKWTLKKWGYLFVNSFPFISSYFVGFTKSTISPYISYKNIRICAHFNNFSRKLCIKRFLVYWAKNPVDKSQKKAINKKKTWVILWNFWISVV